MAYYTQQQLKKFNFRKLGKNIKISDKASLYNTNEICIDDNSRIDDFCVISGKINIGKNVHITPQCLLSGGIKGIILEDCTTLAYGVKVFTQSDDYSGLTMTNSTIPKNYKNEFKKQVVIKRHSIVGCSSIVMPGVTLNEGTSIGAMSLVLTDTKEWSIYVGAPAKKIKNRSKELLLLYKDFLKNN